MSSCGTNDLRWNGLISYLAYILTQSISLENRSLSNIFFLFALVLSSSLCHGQTVNLDPFFQSTYVPPELNQKSADRLQSLFEYYSRENDSTFSFERDEYESFVYKSNYFIEKLNRSGSVFYGDPISQYLNDLKDELLVDHPRRDLIKVYLTKFPSVNAFTNDFGNIYINISVVARAKNEEELLAIMSHEISHVLLRHTHQFEEFSKAIEAEDVDRESDFYVFSKHSFSRENELEADREGFRLLHARNVDLEKAAGLFHQLQYDLDPRHPIRWDWQLLVGEDQGTIQYMEDAKQVLANRYQTIKTDTSDSLSTHPYIGKRIRHIHHFISDSLTQNGPTNQRESEFLRHQKVANRLLINTYIESGWFLEGLHEVLQQRVETPGDPELVKAQAKLLTLICQHAYRSTPFDQYLNLRGDNFQDSAFIAYRELFMSFNSLELNFIALRAVRQLQKDHPDPYLNRVYGYLIAFLYKYNRNLFAVKEQQLQFIPTSKVNTSTVRANTLELDYALNEEAREAFDEHAEEGAVYVPVAPSERVVPMVQDYLKDFPLNEQDRGYIQKFKETRDRHENTLTADHFALSILPTRGAMKNLNGNFMQARDFDKTRTKAFVQSSNIYIEKKKGEFYNNHKKSLELEKYLIPFIQSKEAFDINYSNLDLEELSVLDIHRHYYLKVWIQERFEFNDLIYSKVDEQIQQLVEEKKLRYLIYNFNGVAQQKFNLLGRYSIYSYMIYFDLENQGMVCLSKVGSKEKPSNQVFKQLFYLWTQKI